MNDPAQAGQQPPEGDEYGPAGENLLSAGSIARDLASDVGEGIKDGILDLVFTGLLWGGILLAWICPIAGLVVGAVTTLLALRGDRSKFLPILILVVSVGAWILTQSPLGMLPLILTLL